MCDFIDVLEKHNFKVTEDGDEFEVETWTDKGVNMIIYVGIEDRYNTFGEYVENFDIDEEIDTHRQDKRYKDAFTIKQSLNDFENYHNRLKRVYAEMSK